MGRTIRTPHVDAAKRAGARVLSGRPDDSQIRRCSVTVPRHVPAGAGRLEYLVTRTANHSRDDASSTPHRGRLAALVFAATLAIPVLAQAARAQPGVDANAAAAGLEFAAFDDKGFIEARKSGSPVVLYFESDGCTPCKEMHERTFRAPEVLQAAAGIRLFRVDLTNPDRQIDLLKKSFRVIGAPTLILFGPDGKETARRFGFVTADDFAVMLGKSRTPVQTSRLDVEPGLTVALVRPPRNVARTLCLRNGARTRCPLTVARARCALTVARARS